MLTLEHAPRPKLRLDAAVVFALLWVGLLAIAEVLAQTAVGSTNLCLFRRVTNVPCPTCGATRMVRTAADGHLLDAFVMNPLLAIAGLVLVGWLGLRVGLGRRAVLTASPAMRRWTVVLLIVALLGNWAYVIARAITS